MYCKMKKGQGWSIDVIIAITIFIIVIGSIIFISVSQSKIGTVKQLKTKGDIIYKTLSSNKQVKFINNSAVDIPALCATIQKNYNDIKKEVGLSEDFCIYFEDENGSLIYLDNNQQVPGIGSGRFTINNKPCK